MKVVFDRRSQTFLREKKCIDQTAEINRKSIDLQRFAVAEEKLINARFSYAASRIQGIIRGFLDRLFCKDLHIRKKSTIVLQRLVRGKFGRIRWTQEFYKRISVVKSDSALRDIISRSTLRRENTDRKAGCWREYFDPVTDCFWYYNAHTRRNTWVCPLVLQREFICTWEGYKTYGGLQSQRKCRKVFGDLISYQNHLRECHKWYCAACDHCNKCAAFPTCSMCGNSKSEMGEDGIVALKESAALVQGKLYSFLTFEKARDEDNLNGYSIKNRLVSVALRRQRQAQEMEWDRLMQEKAEEERAAELLRLEEQENVTVAASMIDEESVVGMSNYETALQKRKKKEDALLLKLKKDGDKLPAIDTKHLPTPPPPRVQDRVCVPNLNQLTHVQKIGKTKSNTTKLIIEDSAASITNNENSIQKTSTLTSLHNTIASMKLAGASKPTHAPDMPKFSTVKLAAAHMEDGDNSVLLDHLNAKAADPITFGDIPPSEYDVITAFRDDGIYHQLNNINYDDDDDESLGSLADLYNSADAMKAFMAKSTAAPDVGVFGQDSGDDMSSLASSLNSKKEPKAKSALIANPWGGAATENKILVCVNYLNKKCTIGTTCPFAHPGIRDSAVLDYMRLPGHTRKVPFVIACTRGITQDCPHGTNCPNFHIYIKPPVSELIRKIYPVEAGKVIRGFRGGATYDGEVKDKAMHGHGTITYLGAKQNVYCGGWRNDKRHGLGVFRNTLGEEYVGGWEDGMRSGLGYLTHPNGETYQGEFANGKMWGVGRLSSANGDIFEGEFINHKFEGLGMFRQHSTGSKYMGYSVNGKAHGMGILALANGEKYKGTFDNNTRHGKGTCAFANGSRYAGNWYRGVPDGFGVYMAANGDKYIGEWGGGAKQGTGRYIFAGSGDFYEGQFRRDRAKGVGSYYHMDSGNIYNGEWDNDMRNGRGTYQFPNGSRFTGTFVDNYITGKGKFEYATGCFYRGEFVNNVKHGKGIYTWKNLNSYKGQFVNDKMSGYGEMSYSSGHVYKGNWLENKKEGYGVFKYSNGHRYEGEWKGDLREGKGKMIFLAETFLEEYYEGDFLNDKKHGKGLYRYRKDEGTVYEGDWVEEVREGKGLLSFKDGSYYRGDFVADQMWGQGVYVGADSSQYDGAWYRNMRQGMGTLIDKNGCIFHGEFWANMKHGQGKSHAADGSIFQGNWDGNMVRGSGKYVIPCGEGPRRGMGPTEVKVKVFGF